MAYTPRPGSKTEAAIQFLRDQGGVASAIDIAEAVDTDRKNLAATFLAAIQHGLLESFDDAGKTFYRLLDTQSATAAARLNVARAIPVLGNASPALWPTTEAPKPKRKAVEARAESKPAIAKEPPPAEAAPVVPSFICGRFNDGTLRLEGSDVDIGVESFEGTETYAITLNKHAAAALVEFIRGD